MNTTRVMVVDDDAMVRRVLAASLARAGFDVQTASDGAPALVLAQVAPPDIALVDLHMPTDGLYVAAELKRRYGSAMFVVLLTGDADEETRQRCLDTGADDVLVKPVMPAELRRRLTEAARVLEAVRAAS